MAREKRTQSQQQAASSAQAAAAAAAGVGAGGAVSSGSSSGSRPAEAGRRRAATAESATSEEQCHPRKIFVGGLAHKTTTQQLRDHFQRYGPVVDAVVLRWPDGRSRGFGYVTFAEAGPASAAIRAQPHRVGGRQVDVKRAVPGTNKLFVGGLPQHSTAAELRAHFEAFGVVSDAVVMIDPATNRSRGFGFVCFLPGQEGAEAVTAALAQYQNHRLRGKWIEVKSAAPPHKLANGKEGQSEEERLLAASTALASPDPSPQSADGRPVATPHRQQPPSAARPAGATATGSKASHASGSATAAPHQPRKIVLPDYASAPVPPPGLGDVTPAGAAACAAAAAAAVAAHAASCAPPGLLASGREQPFVAPPQPTSTRPSSAASDPADGARADGQVLPWVGAVTPPPLLWGPGCLSLTSALGAQPSWKAEPAAGGAKAGGPWEGSSSGSPLKVQPFSGLAADPWSQIGLGASGPAFGREFSGGAFGASVSLQKSLEELLRLQSMKFEAEQAAMAAAFQAHGHATASTEKIER